MSDLSPVERNPRAYAYGLYWLLTAMLGISAGLFIPHTFGVSFVIAIVLSVWLGTWFHRTINRIEYPD